MTARGYATPRLGQMSVADIETLENFAVVVEDNFNQMNPNAQNLLRSELDRCLGLVADAKMSQDTSQYLSADACLRQLNVNVNSVLDADEQQFITQPPPDTTEEDAQPDAPVAEDGPLTPPTGPSSKYDAPPTQPGIGTWGWVAIGAGSLVLIVAVASALSK